MQTPTLEQTLLATGHPLEARAWLSASVDAVRTLGEFNPDASARLVERLYGAGAVEVLAVRVLRSRRETLSGDEVRENTGHLVVRLPSDSTKRAKVFKVQRDIARGIGYDGTEDSGQDLLYVKLD